ncbi:MAG TPA: crosslink repair DNA glycosylase YcaQ family protein [Trueperaceae bacterium]|nr:crosslink repair DNA glycosylase YcaQ family protein [Trueperaceae bacterium]
MSEKLTAAEARRIFLHAQGLARKRPSGAVRKQHFREYLRRQGVLQLDSVNVLARAHYMPLYSRQGPYDQAELDTYLWSSADTFEYWGHEASVMPLDLLPALKHRFEEYESRWAKFFAKNPKINQPELFSAVEHAVRERGPLTPADLAHLESAPDRKRGSWWDWSATKRALEYLFFTGRVAVAARKNFQRSYGDPGRVWGDAHGLPALARREAQQELFDHALRANWIGTVADIADHFRIRLLSEAKPLADSAVERGVARWVEVEGWKQPALLASEAEDPGRATGAALLSPFDPAVWFRDRLERMFAMEYRIEIYTPAPKRKYGYYTLPFLLGDQMVGRVDLKADRKAGALLIQAAWREEQPAPGARRRTDADVAAALATELRVMAEWLGLSTVVVKPAGTLAPALDSATRLEAA